MGVCSKYSVFVFSVQIFAPHVIRAHRYSRNERVSALAELFDISPEIVVIAVPIVRIDGQYNYPKYSYRNVLHGIRKLFVIGSSDSSYPTQT